MPSCYGNLNGVSVKKMLLSIDCLDDSAVQEGISSIDLRGPNEMAGLSEPPKVFKGEYTKIELYRVIAGGGYRIDLVAWRIRTQGHVH